MAAVVARWYVGSCGRLASSQGPVALSWGAPAGMLGAVGAVRGKKYKPFHNMFRANKLREVRKKQSEASELAAAQAVGAVGVSETAVARPDEPRVSTTPFQATRLMRAFDVFPEKTSTVQFWTRLNIDLSRESVRGTCHVPHGLQTKIRVLAFCPDDEAEEMIKAGADVAGTTDPIRRIGQGWLGFDRCLATPLIMPQVMKVARVLGPRKLMPTPKSGTVVSNLKQAIKEAKGGTLLEFRAEGEGEVRATIADTTFSDAQVLENMKFLVQTLLRARPRGASGAGGGGGGGSGSAGKALIPGAGGGGGGGKDAQDVYFLEAAVRLGTAGPLVRVDPDTMLPASVGYFR